VHVDHVLKTKLAREAVGPSERFGGEPRQVIDVMGSSLCEQRAQYRIGKDLRVEKRFKAVQRLVCSSVFVQRRHVLASLADIAGSSARARQTRPICRSIGGYTNRCRNGLIAAR
jgi:hypothetical protein